MANNHFICNVYGVSQDPSAGITNFDTPYGLLNSFPSAGVRIYPAPSGTTAGTYNTTIASIIEVLPTGLNAKSTKYYSGASVASLASAAI